MSTVGDEYLFQLFICLLLHSATTLQTIKSAACHGSTILSADFLGQLNRAHKRQPTLSMVWHAVKVCVVVQWPRILTSLVCTLDWLCVGRRAVSCRRGADRHSYRSVRGGGDHIRSAATTQDQRRPTRAVQSTQYWGLSVRPSVRLSVSSVWVRGCRIGPLRFLAGWRKRRLNHAVSFVSV